MIRLAADYRHGRDVLLLCASSALGSGAFLGIHQLLNALYVLRLGFGPQSVGTLSAVGAISFSLSSLLGGIVGVRLGARRMMMLGVMINLVGMALVPLSGAIPSPWQFSWLVGVQILAAAGWSMQVVSVIALMAAFTDPAERRGAYALREASAGLGMLLGTLAGGILPGAIAGLVNVTTEIPAPYGYALWASVLVGGITLVPMYLIAPVQVEQQAQTVQAPFRVELSLILLLMCGFATNAAHAACKTFFSVYLDSVHHLPTALIGAVASAGLLLAIVAALGSGRLAARKSNGQMMLIGALGISISLLIMSLVRHPVGALIGVMGVYGVLGIWRPAYQSLQMEIAKPEWRSVVSGASAMGMSLGFGSMSFGGGYIVVAAGYSWAFLAGMGAGLISALIAVFLTRQMAQSAPQPEV